MPSRYGSLLSPLNPRFACRPHTPRCQVSVPEFEKRIQKSATWPGFIARYGDCLCHVECQPASSAWFSEAAGTRPEFGSSMRLDASTASNAPAGRTACERRSNTAPEPAVGRPPFHDAAKSSYRTQVSLLSMSACASLAGSIGVLEVKG